MGHAQRVLDVLTRPPQQTLAFLSRIMPPAPWYTQDIPPYRQYPRPHPQRVCHSREGRIMPTPKLFLCHRSAANLWRTNAAWLLAHARAARPAAPPALQNPAVELASTLETARSFLGVRHPIHVLISPHSRRTRNRVIETNCWSGPLPSGSFIAVGQTLLVATPEFCAMQMAADELISDAELLAYILEICGTYALQPSGNALYNQPVLSSIKALETFARKSSGRRGARRLKRIIRLAAQGSASPLETLAFELLTLPRALGGEGLPLPALNMRIKIPPELRGSDDHWHRKGDLCWTQPDTEAGVIVEVLGKEPHPDEEISRARDSDREVSLEALGWTVLPVTARQLYLSDGTDRIVQAVRNRLALRWREPQYDHADRRAALRRLLLKPGALRPWVDPQD